MDAGGGVAAAAAQLRSDLALLDASTIEATSLLDTASRQLLELDRQALPMTRKTAALARARANIQSARQRSEEVLEHLDASRKLQGVVQAGPGGDNLQAFLAALERLESALDFLQAHRSMHSAEDAIRHTAALRDTALSACSQEFSTLLHKHSAVPQALLVQLQAAASGSGSSGRGAPGGAPGAAALGGEAPLQLLPDSVLPKLRSLAGAMLHNGSAGRSCVKAYGGARQGVLQSCLEGFLAGFGGGVSKDELARMTWQQMEVKIPGWVTGLKAFVRLAQEEARLCVAIFPAADQATALSQVLAASVASLLESAEAVLGVRRTPDKLFGLMDMHEALEACLPPLTSLLLVAGGPRLEGAAAGAEQLPLVGQLNQLRGRLAAEVRACFADLQDSVSREPPKAAVPADGTVHPLCASTMALLKRVVGYQSALPVLFGDAARSAGRGGRGLAAEAAQLDRMAAAVAGILDTLLAALDARSKLAYKNRALAALHQMNNAHFIVRAVEGSRELKAVGEGWVEQNKGKVEQYQGQYVDGAWGSLLALLRQDARQGMPSGLAADRAARQAVKDKFQAVNKVLAEAQVQQAWSVPDATLRYAVKDALTDALLQPYEVFYNKYHRLAYTDNHSKYERYTPADLQQLLGELFERADTGVTARSSGSTGSGSGLLGRRLSTTSSLRRQPASSGNTLP